jgi:polygalacturonase
LGCDLKVSQNAPTLPESGDLAVSVVFETAMKLDRRRKVKHMKIKLRHFAPLLMMAPALHAALSVSVLSYGAKGDGVTDDTAAITKASTAVAKVGGQLYFPAGTYMINPNKGQIVIGSNMTITGSGIIRVKPNTGNFQRIISPSPMWAPTSNVTIQGITVDENVLNNPSTVFGNETQSQDIIQATMLNGLTLNGVKFYLSGLYAAKINDKLTMTNSTVLFQKRSSNAWFDNSAIYIPASHSTCSITGNTFQGLTDGANNAIEVHYSDNCIISGNKFDNYSGAVLPLDSNHLTISGNTITRAQYAISLWSQNIIQGVVIKNNNISLNNRDRQSNAAAGIALYWCSSCQMTGDFYNIQIQNNSITFQAENRSNVSASSYWGIGIMPAGDVNEVTISGNTITNAPIRAITIGNSLKPGQTTSNISVTGNNIISPGNNTAKIWYEAGITLQGRLINVNVEGNVIKNTVNPFTGKYGIWSDSAGSYSKVLVQQNTIDPVYANSLARTIIQ